MVYPFLPPTQPPAPIRSRPTPVVTPHVDSSGHLVGIDIGNTSYNLDQSGSLHVSNPSTPIINNNELAPVPVSNPAPITGSSISDAAFKLNQELVNSRVGQNPGLFSGLVPPSVESYFSDLNNRLQNSRFGQNPQLLGGIIPQKRIGGTVEPGQEEYLAKYNQISNSNLTSAQKTKLLADLYNQQFKGGQATSNKSFVGSKGENVTITSITPKINSGTGLSKSINFVGSEPTVNPFTNIKSNNITSISSSKLAFNADGQPYDPKTGILIPVESLPQSFSVGLRNYIKNRNPVTGTVDFIASGIREKLSKIENGDQFGQSLFSGETGQKVQNLATSGLYIIPEYAFAAGLGQVLTAGGIRQIKAQPTLLGKGLLIGGAALGTVAGGIGTLEDINSLTGYPKFATTYISKQSVNSINGENQLINLETTAKTVQRNLLSEQPFFSASATQLALKAGETEDLLFGAKTVGATQKYVRDAELDRVATGELVPFASKELGIIKPGEITAKIGGESGLDIYNVGPGYRTFSQGVIKSGEIEQKFASTGVGSEIDDTTSIFASKSVPYTRGSNGISFSNIGQGYTKGIIIDDIPTLPGTIISNGNDIIPPTINPIPPIDIPQLPANPSPPVQTINTGINPEEIALARNSAAIENSVRIQGLQRSSQLRSISNIGSSSSGFASIGNQLLFGKDNDLLGLNNNLGSRISQNSFNSQLDILSQNTPQTQRPLTNQRQNQNQDQQQGQEQISSQQTSQLQRQIQTNDIFPNEPGSGTFDIPFSPILLGIEKNRRRKRLQTVAAYNVLIRKRGKYIPVATNLTRSQALQFGSNRALKDIARTFKITESGKLFDTGINDIEGFNVNPNQFRNYQVRKGRRVPLINTYVQLTKANLQSPQEIFQISQAKRNKKQFGNLID